MVKLRVVVLGAGFGGLELSTLLSEALGEVSSPKLRDQAADGTATATRWATRSAKGGVVAGVMMRSRRE